MKTPYLIILLSGFWLLNTQGQAVPSSIAAATGPTGTLPDTPYAVVDRGANSRVWQRTTYETTPDGKQIPRTHQYTELATGLHYQKKGQWVESKEEIEILPNGTAAAVQGQHQAYFPGNIYQGVIELVTPDGKHLRSRPLGLSYDDGSHTVLIAELKDSVGQLVGPNQVIYPDAFTDFKADLRYTYTKAGFEQDIILREQPLTPESYGLNPTTARLEVLTEFFNPPQPTMTTARLPQQAGIALNDENLDFGAMKMILGRAFLLGSDAHEGGVLVSKSWLKLEGRQFLVEEVPVDALADELAQLPVPQTASTKPKVNSTLQVASAKRLLPAPRLTKTSPGGQFRQVAQAATPARGLVLDYVTLNSNTNNFTFQGDTTYYISGAVNLAGNITFEGGAVLKYTNNAALNVSYPAQINCLATSYRPVIFTAKDDNSVGDTINGSTGTPTNYYANPAISYTGSSSMNSYMTLSHFRIAYASQAVSANGVSITITLADGQIINCANGFYTPGQAEVYLNNLLFANFTTALSLNFANVHVQNVTFAGKIPGPGGVSFLVVENGYRGSVTLNCVNCILANIVSLSGGPPLYPNSLGGSNNGFYNSPLFGTATNVSSVYPFQSVGAGNYYLTNGCNFFNQGTTNIDSALLAALHQKTTYPPIVCSNITISVTTNFSPQAQRDTNALPDLGYHYNPIDYIADSLTITNAALTVTNGAVIANYNRSGIQLQTGSSMVSMGSPLVPNRFVRYQSVQEQSIVLGGTNLTSALSVNPNHPGSTGPTATFRFTQFACPAAGGSHLFDAGSTNYNSLLVQDCEFWGGQNNFTGATNTTATLKNNLFYRSVITAAATNLSSTLCLTNNLFFGAAVKILQPTNTVWCAFNNDFDTCTITNSTLTNGYNAYLNCSGRLQPTNTHDVVSSSGLAYQTGSLGSFYQPSGSPLINWGSTTADQVGLYHFTTQTNQMKETNSVVDIGYHYVAVDGYGNPLDTDGDGMPDYLEDSNGNDIYDTGDLGNWLISPFNGLTIGSGLSVFTPLK
jgi:hypothetical protein